MSMLSDDSIFAEQMLTLSASSLIEVANVDTPRDTDYERPYLGIHLGEEQDDGDPDHAPAGHCWPRLLGHTELGPNSEIESSPLPPSLRLFPSSSQPSYQPSL